MHKACSIALATMMGVAAPAFVAQSTSAADLPVYKEPYVPPQAVNQCPDGTPYQNGCCPEVSPPGVNEPGVNYCVPWWGIALGGALVAGAITVAVIETEHHAQVSP